LLYCSIYPPHPAPLPRGERKFPPFAKGEFLEERGVPSLPRFRPRGGITPTARATSSPRWRKEREYTN